MSEKTALLLVIIALLIFAYVFGELGYNIAYNGYAEELKKKTANYTILKSFLEDSGIADKEWLEAH